jgi:hypothetical protein
MAAKVGQGPVDGVQLFLQRAAYLTGGVGGGVGSFRFNQVNDGLRLGQVQLAV